MKIEKIGETNKYKWIIIGFIICASLFVMINYLITKAKYRNTESVDLVKGTITYNKADLNIIAMYQESSYGTNGYKQIDDVPTEKYTLSNKSYCEVEGQKVEEAQITYEEGYISVSKINKRGTKCYIYFDLDYTSEDMLAKLEETKQSTYEKTTMPNPITGPYDEQKENPEHKEKLYTTEDNYGTSYVFRGNNEDVNNWVTFANHTWRIIRINGDGTLRMIFQCATPGCTDTEGSITTIGNSAYKLAPFDDNAYVGYYYGEAGQDTYDKTHTNAYPSKVSETIKEWYNKNDNMTNYTKYLSGDTGWCNDRVVVQNLWESAKGDGSNKSTTIYGPANRQKLNNVWRKEQYANLKCGTIYANDLSTFSYNEKVMERDLFTTEGSIQGNGKLPVPAALITSDEALMVGGFGGTASTNHWLYTNQNYWTMSPFWYDGNMNWAVMFAIKSDGSVYHEKIGITNNGVRPVINLNADIEFSGGDGKSSNPFIVKTNI